MHDRRPPSLASARGELPLRAVDVRARIAGCTADVQVEQVFENVFDEALEVSYVFPLPELAAVTRCELQVGDRVIAARLEERGAARAGYARAIEAGRRAALAEQERPDVFTITLGNLQPGERATVRFAMAHVLPREYGRHVFHFPLVVGDRYVPGAPLASEQVGDGTATDTTDVRDAARVSPPRLAPDAERPALSIDIALVHGALAIGELECSWPTTRETSPGCTHLRVAPDQRLDRDFVLRFRIGDDAVRSQLVVVRDDAAPYRAAPAEATFQLTLAPPLARLRARPRDIVLLLDRSGSMAGWKIVAARRALARMIDVLDDDDRFAVYAFGSETVACVELAPDRLHAASAHHRACATGMLSAMDAAGGTEMLQPLELATSLLAGGDAARDRWIVLVTDGQVANEDALVALVQRTPGAKVLALGIDDAIGSSLLRRLATATGGRIELVHGEGELEDALDRLHLLLGAPVIERVTVEAEGIVPGSLAPAGPLHVFPGVPLIVRGRCRGELSAVRVRGKIRGEPFDTSVAVEPCDLAALRACWAREHLIALEDRFAAGDRGSLVDEIVATSLRFGVLCRFTAFVAIDDGGPAVDVATRHVAQPVELPAIAASSRIPATRWGAGGATARSTKTQSGVLRGKLAYLSPEQVRGRDVAPSHEVFALARLLYEMLTGRMLHRGQNDFELLQAIFRAVLPSPLLPPELAHLAPILSRALASEPVHRYARPGSFADALAAAAPHVASLAAVAAWLAAVDPDSLAVQAAWLARAAEVRTPADGYYLLAPLAQTGDASLFVAARDRRAVVLARLHAHCVADADHVEHFLSEAALASEGFAGIDDAGVDDRGGVFRARPFVHGLTLMHVLRVTRAPIPAPIALAIICSAARALDAALDLGSSVGLIVRDIAPSSLLIGVDGRPVWLSVGAAPAPEYAARRRLRVPLAVPSHLALDAPAVLTMPARFVVVPKRRKSWWRG